MMCEPMLKSNCMKNHFYKLHAATHTKDHNKPKNAPKKTGFLQQTKCNRNDIFSLSLDMQFFLYFLFLSVAADAVSFFFLLSIFLLQLFLSVFISSFFRLPLFIFCMCVFFFFFSLLLFIRFRFILLCSLTVSQLGWWHGCMLSMFGCLSFLFFFLFLFAFCSYFFVDYFFFLCVLYYFYFNIASMSSILFLLCSFRFLFSVYKQPALYVHARMWKMWGRVCVLAVYVDLYLHVYVHVDFLFCFFLLLSFSSSSYGCLLLAPYMLFSFNFFFFSFLYLDSISVPFAYTHFDELKKSRTHRKHRVCSNAHQCCVFQDRMRCDDSAQQKIPWAQSHRTT